MVLSMNILTLIYSPGFAHIVFPITGLKKETPHMDLALESETYIEAKSFCLDVVRLVSRSNTTFLKVLPYDLYSVIAYAGVRGT